MSVVEREYEARMAVMSIAEKMLRSSAIADARAEARQKCTHAVMALQDRGNASRDLQRWRKRTG